MGLDKRFGALEKIALSFMISVTFASLFTAAIIGADFSILALFGPWFHDVVSRSSVNLDVASSRLAAPRCAPRV